VSDVCSNIHAVRPSAQIHVTHDLRYFTNPFFDIWTGQSHQSVLYSHVLWWQHQSRYTKTRCC